MTYLSQSIKTEILFQLANGDEGVCVLWCRKQDLSDPTAGDLGVLAGLISTWIANDDFEGETNLAMYKHLNEHTIFSLVRCTAVGTVPPLQVVVNVGIPGTNTGVPAAAESAIVNTWYTVGVGRSYRGRNYWPGYAPGGVDTSGHLSGSQVTSWHTTLSALIAGLVSHGSFELVVHSDRLSQNNSVLSCVVRPVIHHQSRRNG